VYWLDSRDFFTQQLVFQTRFMGVNLNLIQEYVVFITDEFADFHIFGRTMLAEKKHKLHGKRKNEKVRTY